MPLNLFLRKKIISQILLIFFLLLNVLNAKDLHQNVTLQLSWKHQFQFAGYYIAKEKGFYKDLDINVNIKEFNSGIDVTNSIIKQDNHFAVGDRKSVV